MTSLDFFGMSADSVKNPSDIAIYYVNNDSVLYDSMISHKRKQFKVNKIWKIIKFILSFLLSILY